MSLVNPSSIARQNVSIAQLLEWSKTNPNRGHKLNPIRIQATVEDNEERGASMKNMGLPTYYATPLNPSGILSIAAWVRDPMYQHALPTVRSTTIREMATALQIETERLTGSHLARKRRCIYDAIGTLVAGDYGLKEDDRPTVLTGLAYMLGVQFVFIDHKASSHADGTTATAAEAGDGISVTDGEKGHVYFSSDPATWDKEMPIWIADWHGRWIATPADSDSSPLWKRIGEWFSWLETNSWTIDWKEADGTKEEIVNQLVHSITWKPTDAKLKKDVLSKRLGRERAIHTMSGWLTA